MSHTYIQTTKNNWGNIMIFPFLTQFIEQTLIKPDSGRRPCQRFVAKKVYSFISSSKNLMRS